MKIFNKNLLIHTFSFSAIILGLAFSIVWTKPASAHVAPAGCSGSGLGISLFTDVAQTNIGNVINYSVLVFNGAIGGPVVCDADGITASLVTPDGVNHPITLTRTALSDGQFDLYSNIVSYTALAANISADGTLAATASDTGTIHQNIVDSLGGGNQGVNVYVLNTLHVIKTVVNTGGGTATPSSFSLHVKDGATEVSGSPAVGVGSPGTLYSLIAGTYTVSENPVPSYVATFTGDCDATGNVTLVGANDKTCTVTNTFVQPATIRVNKVVVNDDGGSKVIGDFPLLVGSTTVASGAVTVFPAGAYTVTETVDPDYTQAYSGDCDVNGLVTIAPGDHKICTITNNDIPPAAASINVIKIVVNDNGGTKTIADFPLFVVELPPIIRIPNIFFANIAHAQSPGTLVISGVTNIFPGNTSYIVSETSDPNYVQSFSGDCNASGLVTLVPGDHKVCTITNDDIAAIVPPPVVPPPTGGGGSSSSSGGSIVPPIIDVIKVPDPLALPGGPGLVKYTYTLRNIGLVPVTNITMVGDTCRPIVLISGDTNNDSILGLNETWVYTCSTTLTATHTNTVTATGWANGISASDVAIATVVVGAPGLPIAGIVPPLIHVTKVPNPLALGPGGGLVTFTNKVTNPGIVPLSNVVLVDDKCGPVQYISGDTNGNSLLDTNEEWTYTCQSSLLKTTTNTAIATGVANGFTVRDVAIVTVIVAVPGLPNTGYSPDSTGISSDVAILVGVLLLVSVSLVLLRKKIE